MSSVSKRFLRYVKIDTQSDHDSSTIPTTENQWELARLLEKELEQLGLQDVKLNQKCFVTATLPANVDKKLPVIGFLAHMDTSPDFSGKNVKPQVIENYDGGDISLNKAKKMSLSPQEFPTLKHYVGQTLITTDGSTLLGADDKAGLAEIMTALEYMLEHPEFKHGTIKVAFTPDEETGKGNEYFDIKSFAADFAYTLDGGPVGELEYENFNADRADITVKGKSVHPGDAKGVLVNSQIVFMEFFNLLPAAQRPEYTQGREGFFHLWRMTKASVEETQAQLLIRDHDSKKFKHKQEMLLKCAEFINHKYGPGTVSVDLVESYRNMKAVIQPVMHIVETAKQAMQELGIKPVIKPIRGGTDGARLSYMGLPTPNLFAGGHNFHGPYEYIPVQSMEKAVQVILKIIELYSQK
ncbi:MAG TPA: peptidase T [Anaerolineae bacterium]|nr:peptidase T [Anaerolineae bacterium]